MPPVDWQLIVVMLIVAAAATYLVRRGLTTFRSSSQRASGPGSCGTCGSCNSVEQASGNSRAGFVPIENLTSRKPRL